MSRQETFLEAAHIAQAYESEGGEYALAAKHIAGKLREQADAEGIKRLSNINPWHPIKDTVELKHLGKLGEECGELASIICRCIIQGVDEHHPITNVSNRKALEDEIADVLGNIQLVIKHFDLNLTEILQRSLRKQELLKTWHKMA